MRVAIQCGLLVVMLAALPRLLQAQSKNEQWETTLKNVQALIQTRTKEVRELRKKTDEFVEKLNELARNKVLKLTPEAKRKLALQRINYYTQLGGYNAAIIEMEQTLPKQVAPIARQKVLDALAALRNEVRATVVSLNHVARSLKDL